MRIQAVIIRGLITGISRMVIMGGIGLPIITGIIGDAAVRAGDIAMHIFIIMVPGIAAGNSNQVLGYKKGVSLMRCAFFIAGKL